jgi:hypothetical protein
MKNATRVLYIALAALALSACEHRLDTSKATRPEALAASGTSGNLVGTPPAPPTVAEGTTETTPVQPGQELTGQPKLRETAQTTESSLGSKELTKGEESTQMPLPGQPNDHSNVAPDASQKAGGSDPQQQPERKSQ